MSDEKEGCPCCGSSDVNYFQKDLGYPNNMVGEIQWNNTCNNCGYYWEN